MGPGGAAGHRRRVDEPERVRVDRDLRGQRVQGLVQQRPGSVDPLAVAGLLGQVGEHPTQAAVAETQPACLRGAIQHHLRYGQADQLRVGEPLGPSWPTTFGRQNLVIDEHVQCGQEGVEVSSHERPSTPSNPFRSSRHAEGFGIDRLVLIDCQRRNLLADLVACVDLGSFIELCGEDVDLRRVWSGRTEYRTDWYQPSQGGHTLNAGSTGAGKNSRTSAPIVSIADHERPPAWGPAAVRSSAARPVRGAVILGGCGDRPLRAFRAVGWAVIDG